MPIELELWFWRPAQSSQIYEGPVEYQDDYGDAKYLHNYVPPIKAAIMPWW